MRRRIPAILGACVLLFGLAVPATSGASGAATFSFFAGSGPVCGLAPDACPDVAAAPNGDTVTLTGAGQIAIHPDSAGGGGSFTHKDPSGHVRGSGTWTATELISFHPYGSGSAQGLPPALWGGQALIRVHLSAGATQADGILTVDCELGKVPGGAAEGITLLVPQVIHFNKSTSGFTVFVKH